MATYDVRKYDYGGPVKSVALDPMFSRKSERPFIVGLLSGHLKKKTKGFWTDNDTVLHSGEGPVLSVQWRGNFVAWANDAGVKACLLLP